MSNGISDSQADKVLFTPEEKEALFMFQQNKIRDLNFMNRLLYYENRIQIGHIKSQNMQMDALVEKINELQRELDGKSGGGSFFKRLQAKIFRLYDNLLGYSVAGEYRRWKFYQSVRDENTVFSNRFFSFLAQEKVLGKLFDREDNGLRIPADMPKTSVVLQTCGSAAKVIRFLEIFFLQPPTVPFEIIISGKKADKLSKIAKFYPGVRLLPEMDKRELETQISGEYLLFVNDDFALVPGAVDELAGAIFRRKDADAVGGQVFHGTNGKLLESGTILCRNGEFIRQGFEEDPKDSRISFFRECDCYSHPVFITRRNVFADAPESDSVKFTAGIALDGKKNFVMPLAKIMFFGAENGLELSEVPEKTKLSNAHWQSREEWENGSKFSKPAVLYIDAEIPQPDRGSGGMDVIFFVEYMLKRGYHVLFFGENTPKFIPKYTPMLQRLGVECFTAGEVAFRGYLENYGKYFSFAFVSRVYQAKSFDSMIRCHLPQAAYIFNTVDLHFVREKLEAQLNNSESDYLHAAMTEQLELSVMARSDAVIVISSDEKKMLENDYGITDCTHIPQAREIMGRKNCLADRHSMVFIGSAHQPNVDAVRYYAEEILPLLKADGLDGSLTVIGEALRNTIMTSEGMEAVINAPEIKFVGFVEELGDYLDSARITIAPLRYGAGTKGKVASSMAYGVPCVSSNFGTEGTGMTDGENILIARTPREFAEKISALMRDDLLWQKISDGGLRFLEDNYATGTVEKKMDELFAKAKENMLFRQKDIIPLTRENFDEIIRNRSDSGNFEPVFAWNNAAVFWESNDVSPEFAACHPKLKNGTNILLEKERFNYIILSAKPENSDRRELSVSHAFDLLFDGGKIYLPAAAVPEDKARFFDLVEKKLNIQYAEYSFSLHSIIFSKVIPN